MNAADVVTIDRATAEQLVVTLEAVGQGLHGLFDVEASDGSGDGYANIWDAVEKARRSIEAALGLSEPELEALADRGSELWFNEWQKADERLMCEAFGRRLSQALEAVM